jgi:type 2 lantibiotic biosynthesis protein LanM
MQEEIKESPSDSLWIDEINRIYSAHVDGDGLYDGFDDCVWEGTNAYLWLAYPIVKEAKTRLGACQRRTAAGGAPFDPADVERLVVPNLLRMLKPILISTMTLELNVARIRNSLAGASGEDRFRCFCDSLRQPSVRAQIIAEYPMMFRALYLRMLDWVSYSAELLDRLATDWEMIKATFGAVGVASRVVSIDAGAGDSHARGRTVAIVTFSCGLKIVYKPRRLSLDVHFAQLIDWINARGFAPRFRQLNILDFGSYGWTEFIAHSPCTSRDQIERFYQRLGGYLAVFYALHACDMHFDNIISSGEFPVPVDLEALFHPDVQSDDPAVGPTQPSVLQVLMLPKRIYASATATGVDISGLGASGGQTFPAGTLRSWQGAGTDAMHLVRDQAIPMGTVRSQPMLCADKVDYREFRDAFVAGFESCYRLLARNRDELMGPRGVLARFSGDEVRFIRRATRSYATLLDKAYHPDNLRDSTSYSCVFDILATTQPTGPHADLLADAERRDLLNGDIPIFFASVGNCDVWTSRRERLTGVFAESPLNVVRGILRGLGDMDLDQQQKWIYASLSN